MPFIVQDVPLVVIGGVPPYTAQIVVDAANTFAAVGGVASIIGINPWTPPATGTLHLDASAVEPGVYKTHVRVTDAATPTHNVTDSLVSVVVADPAILTILNDDEDFQPSSFPQVFAIPLNANGGVAPYTWSIIDSVTTIPNPTIDNVPATNTLHFTLSTYGTFTIGLNVVDSVGISASKVVTYSIQNSVLFALVDGQLEVLMTVPNTKTGTHNFTATIQDSSAPVQTKTSTLYYQALEPYSEVQIPEFAFDHYWGNGDLTKIVYPITGLNSLQGYSLGTPAITQPANGLTVIIDNVNNVAIVAGPPDVFRDSEPRIPLPILHGTTQVAVVSREFTLLAHNGTTDIGTVNMFPRPFIVGDFVGLNPQKPGFNNPSIQKAANLTVRVQAGSVLPAGLSLDANTGLVYGNLAGTTPLSSVVEYVDPQGLVHGTVTISWSLYQSGFTLINNLGSAQIQQNYTGTITSNSQAPLTSVAIVHGVLPQGLTAGVTSTQVNVTGIPLESGYFDIWWAVTNANNQTAYLRTRFVSNYIAPLTILTTSLPTFSNQPYALELQGFGGIPPYTWSLDPSSPILPGGFLLSSAGVLSGTYTNSPAPYSQTIIIDLTDSASPSPATTQAQLQLVYDNTLKITTPAIPIIVPGQNYSFAMQATGGQPPYTWSVFPPVTGLVPPTGISFSTSGIFAGVTSQTTFTESITITVTDSAFTTANHIYTLQIGTPSGLNIDTADVGPIIRGVAYQGHLSVFGPGVAPYAWQIPPSSPNSLPTGLALTADATTAGVTATISGTYSGAVLTNFPVEVEVVDSNGNFALAYMLMNTNSGVTIDNPSLPQGTTLIPYTVQLAASGGVPPYTFTIDPSSPLTAGYLSSHGLTLTSGGLFSGTPNIAINGSVIFDVADSVPVPHNTGQRTYPLVVQATSLTITTTSPLFPATSGLFYAANLLATGGTPPYVWSVSPSTGTQLPPGLHVITFSPTVGNVAGTTTVPGTYPVTYRVTDSIGSFVEKVLSLTVASGLQLQSGIAYSNGINFWQPTHPYLIGQMVIDSNNNVQVCSSAGTSGATHPAWNTSGTTLDIAPLIWTFVGPSYIGYVDNGNVAAMQARPSDSFFVVATGVVSTQINQLVVNIGSSAVAGVTAQVISIVGGVAQIQLTGPFSQGAAGDNSVTLTVTDSGVQASATFKWKVYTSGALRLAPGSGSFPAQFFG